MFSVVTTAEHQDGTVAYTVREQRDQWGQTVLTFAGELDYEANAVVDSIVGRLLGGSAGDVVVDLSGVAFLNGHGLAAMLHLQRGARARDRRLILRCHTGTVRRLLELVGLAANIDEVELVSGPIAPVLRLVQDGERDVAGRSARRRHRSRGPVSRRWHHGEE